MALDEIAFCYIRIVQKLLLVFKSHSLCSLCKGTFQENEINRLWYKEFLFQNNHGLHDISAKELQKIVL